MRIRYLIDFSRYPQNRLSPREKHGCSASRSTRLGLRLLLRLWSFLKPLFFGLFSAIRGCLSWRPLSFQPIVSCRAEIFIECGLYLRFGSRRIFPKIMEDKTQYDEDYEKCTRPHQKCKK